MSDTILRAIQNRANMKNLRYAQRMKYFFAAARAQEFEDDAVYMKELSDADVWVTELAVKLTKGGKSIEHFSNYYINFFTTAENALVSAGPYGSWLNMKPYRGFDVKMCLVVKCIKGREMYKSHIDKIDEACADWDSNGKFKAVRKAALLAAFIKASEENEPLSQ